MRKKRLVAGLLCTALTMNSFNTVFANSTQVTGNSAMSESFATLTASASMLGGDLIVTIPDSLPLSKSGTDMVGTGTVTAEGNCNPSAILTVTTDTTITYENQSDKSITVPASVDFGVDGQAQWTAVDLKNNLTASSKMGYNVTATVPMSKIEYVGDYKSKIVFNITLEAPDTTTYYMGYSLSEPESVSYSNDANIPYDTYAQSDQVAELKEFSLDRSTLEGRYDIIVESTDSNLVIPSTLDGYDVVGASFESFFAEDEIATYVSNIEVPDSVTGVELADADTSASTTVITCYNLRAAVKLSKILPSGATVKFKLKNGEKQDYTEYFRYEWYSTYNGYLVTGFSQYGYEELKSKGSDITVEIQLPMTYNDGSHGTHAVVGLSGSYLSFGNNSKKFETAMEDTDFPSMEWVFPDCYKYCKGFFGCDVSNEAKKKLKGLTLNEGLEVIYQEAFRDFDSLTSIHIPSTVTSIESRAFYDCNNLSTITFADGFNGSIGDSNFACTAATEITLPSSLTSFNVQALGNSDSNHDIRLIRWNINHDVPTFDHDTYNRATLIKYADGDYTGFGSEAKAARLQSDDGITATISSDITAGQYESSSSKGYDLNIYKHIIIADGVTSIGEEGLSCYSTEHKSPETISIPDSVTTFGYKAVWTSGSNLGTIDMRNKIYDSNPFYGSKIENLTVGVNEINAAEGATVTNMYIDYDGSSTLSSESNIKVTNVYFSGTEEQWTTFKNSKTTFDDSIVMFNATID